MPIFGWIRDALGLHKDIIDSKKSVLEVEKLKDEKRERETITRATIDDVRKYDHKVQLLESKIELEKKKLKLGAKRPPNKRSSEKFVKIEDAFAWRALIVSFVIILIFIISQSC